MYEYEYPVRECHNPLFHWRYLLNDIYTNAEKG